MTVMVRRTFALLSLVVTTSACEGRGPTAPSPPTTNVPVAGTQPGPAPAPAPTPTPAPPPVSTSVSWDDLPNLSQAGRQFITDNNLNRYGEMGAVKRWEVSQISVYVTPDIARSEVDQALRFWEQVMEGKITFQISGRSEDAHIVLDTLWDPPAAAPPDTCGEARVTKMERNVVLSGVAHFNKVRCGVYAQVIAHEIGHLIGPSGGHTERGTVMSNVYVELVSTPLIDETYNWLPRVPAGTRPR